MPRTTDAGGQCSRNFPGAVDNEPPLPPAFAAGSEANGIFDAFVLAAGDEGRDGHTIMIGGLTSTCQRSTVFNHARLHLRHVDVS